MRRVTFALVAFVFLAGTHYSAFTQNGLSAVEAEAAIDLAMNGDPAPYPLYARSDPPKGAAPTGFALTPFMRASLAAYQMLHDRAVVPQAADLLNKGPNTLSFGNDKLVYVALLDFGIVDRTSRLRRESEVKKEVAVALLENYRFPFRMPTGGPPPTEWACWAEDSGIRSQDVKYPGGAIIIAAFERGKLAAGGYIVAGVDGRVLGSAYVQPGDAKSWR